jgi:hypothetical protein
MADEEAWSCLSSVFWGPECFADAGAVSTARAVTEPTKINLVIRM